MTWILNMLALITMGLMYDAQKYTHQPLWSVAIFSVFALFVYLMQ
jgi:hypothetical protein